ncbi:DUF2279 domain-containing protein [Fulvitalea axinellae]|uniref:DUF2279 domain-containing protein n=1 Tax=Fulvitalea axinellae TaxID=1182444 RepID=A0AAU9C9Y8_9BACT|nr:DUF2279 domain-containing protein [Fulvitalea axinellae]
MRRALLGLIFILSTLGATAQTPDSLKRNDNRKLFRHLTLGAGVYTASLIGLNQVWYSEDRSSFHWFDDLPEWKQMDKAGHAFSAFHLGRLGYEYLGTYDISERKRRFWGSLSGALLLSPIELLDGFQPEYGASASDLVANLTGSALLWGQLSLWNEIRIKPKFSYRASPYAELRPNTLGSTWNERLLKDYNAQTYWLSFDIHAFLPSGNAFPKWLNLALGYGADGMVYARDSQNEAHGHRAYRQYYLALDWDLSHIKTRRKGIKALLFVLDAIHLPAPGLGLDERGNFSFHALYP